MLQIFIILLLIQIPKIHGTSSCSSDIEGSTTTVAPCGMYGFRCVDERTYQICAIPDPEGNLEFPELTRECFKGLNCDEENPAFCTPIDEEMVAAKKANEIRIKKDIGTHFGEMFDKNGEEVTSCYSHLDVENSTPIPGDEEEVTQNYVKAEYECPGFGQFPDSANKGMFWYCDSNEKGTGYAVRHMTCGKKRRFDPRLRECVMCGTTRDIRSVTTKQDLLEICRLNRKTHRFRLKRGDCGNYYLCYNYNKDVMKMQCPQYYQFSDRFSRCMPAHLVDCDAQNQEEEEAEEDEEAADYDLED